MENFKKALKQAILDKAEAVRFEEAQKPQMMTFASERAMNPLPEQTREDVLTLIESLIPSARTQSNLQVREGVLAIVNFGELKLLAVTGEVVRLFAFIPPQGTHLYQQIKSQLLSQTLRPALKPIAIEQAEPEPEPMAADETALPTENRNHGQFAMSSVTDQGVVNGVPVANMFRTEESKPAPDPAPPAFGLAAPPALQGAINEAGDESVPVKPRLEKSIPVDFSAALADPVPAPDAHPLQVATPVLHTMISVQPPVPDAPESISSGFQKEEATETEDYHFKQSIVSHERMPNEYTNTYAAVHPPVKGPSTPYHAADGHTRDMAGEGPAIIHFGADIPGESIDRKGRLPIDVLLEQMVEKKASDLHLTLNEPACVRVDGEIARLGESALTEEQMRSYILPIMPPKNQQEFARSCDTDFSYEVPGLARFRVNVFRNRKGVGAVLRVISSRILSADDLGLPPPIRKFCELQKGLVLVTGPTGSGKTTTLSAMVDLINETRSDHILTIEDPIEFVHPQKRCLVNQREVHKHTESFSRALRAALREDPDIILIGEMRDLETVAIAIETAETGHLVFGTLHTNTAISTVDRLIDQFPADQQAQVRVMLAESLKGVVAQTLVKKKGGGRVAAHEILVVDRAVSSMIREGNTHMAQNHMQTQKAKGNCTLNDSLLALVTKGLVEPRDAYTKALDKDAFASMLQQKGITLEATTKSA